ncbi:MAG: efflux RND transporter permease subunit [Myxococcota bacterium]
MSLSDLAIRRPVFTTMVMVALVVLGAVGFSRLPVDLFPDVSVPIVTIRTPYPGAGPEEVEELVTRPLEDAVSALAGIDRVESWSREGLSTVVVTFGSGADPKLLAVDVRDRVAAAARGMPRDVSPPELLRVDPDAIPIRTVVLSGKADPRELRRFADREVRPLLEQADGVGSVAVRGGAVREIGVELYAERLAHYGVSVAEVSEALALENTDVPAGALTGGASETAIRLLGQLRSLDELRAAAVGRSGTELVRVHDLGDVVDRAVAARTRVRVNGAEAVVLEVVKRSGGNTVTTADAIDRALVTANRRLPGGWTLDTVIDGAAFVRANTRDVEWSVLFGGLAAIAVVWVFMADWRSTVIVGLALPVTVIGTMFGLWAAGFSLNMMSLTGLSLAIGFLIDDAIVVRENIWRHLEAGEPPVEAASRGTAEIALAVVATTSTILAVFVPVAFMTGVIGQFFRPFGWTIAIAVSLSLGVALTLDPMLSAHWVRPPSARPPGWWQRTLASVDAGYRELLSWALRHRIGVVAVSVGLLALAVGALGLMGSEFVPVADRGQYTVELALPPGSSLDRTSAVTAEVERMLQADPDTRLVYAVIGVDGEARRASIRVRTTDKRERERSLDRIQTELRRSLTTVPGIQFSIAAVGFVETDGELRTRMPVTIAVRGPEFVALDTLARTVAERVRATPGVVDVDTTWSPGNPELRVTVDREASSRLGVSAGRIGAALRSAVVGEVPTRFRDGPNDWDVRVRLREEDRNDRSKLDAIPVPTAVGPIPLRQVATIEQGTGPSTIERADRLRRIRITANVVGRSLGEVVSEIDDALDTIDVPPGYGVTFEGEARELVSTRLAFAGALGLAVVFIYVVLASQFESFVHPITILGSLPFALIGAVLGLFLTGNPLGMPAYVGVVLLMGLVGKNAILVVDLANQLRDRRGLDAHTALLEAGPRRLRPILMTSAAMVLGMVPSALSRGAGSEFRAPMAIAVIGGVLTSTALTLVVVPVLYSWLDRATARHRRQKLGRVEIRLE